MPQERQFVGRAFQQRQGQKTESLVLPSWEREGAERKLLLGDTAASRSTQSFVRREYFTMSGAPDPGTLPLRPALRLEEDPLSPKSGPVKGEATNNLGVGSKRSLTAFLCQLSSKPHANDGQSSQLQNQKRMHSPLSKILRGSNSIPQGPQVNE